MTWLEKGLQYTVSNAQKSFDVSTYLGYLLKNAREVVIKSKLGKIRRCSFVNELLSLTHRSGCCDIPKPLFVGDVRKWQVGNLAMKFDVLNARLDD